MSRLTLGVCIVIGWMFLWGDVGVGPVIGGTLVVVALYVVFPSSRASFPRVVVHPFAVARLFAYFVRQLVVSNALLTRELLRRRNSICTRVVEIPMRTSVPSLLTMVTNLASLSPGTIVVDADESAPGTPPTLVVHVLVFGDLDDPEAAIRSVHALEERCVLAFGTNDAIRELELAR